MVLLVVVVVAGGVGWAVRDQKGVGEGQEVVVDQPYKSEELSVDGTMMLTMRQEGQKDRPQTYSFWVKNISGKDKDTTERLIFTKVVRSNEAMAIHHNSWSPNNKYVLLEEKDGSGQIKFFVFKVSGEAFADGEPYMNVEAVFDQKKTGWSLREVTGWDGEALVNITTRGDEGKNGPGYWLDMGSRSLMQHR